MTLASAAEVDGAGKTVVVVADVDPDGPAAQKGIRTGDVGGPRGRGGRPSQARRRRIGPDVRSPAPALAKLDVVDVRSGTVLAQGQQLMLGAVEAAHAATTSPSVSALWGNVTVSRGSSHPSFP